MKILVIGGTGTMGHPLVELLAKDNRNNVFYISRNGGVLIKRRN